RGGGHRTTTLRKRTTPVRVPHPAAAEGCSPIHHPGESARGLPDAVLMSTKPLAHQVVPGARGAESSAAEGGAVRSRDSLFHWCGTVDAIRVTPNRPEKRAILDAYFEEIGRGAGRERGEV